MLEMENSGLSVYDLNIHHLRLKRYAPVFFSVSINSERCYYEKALLHYTSQRNATPSGGQQTKVGCWGVREILMKYTYPRLSSCNEIKKKKTRKFVKKRQPLQTM